LQEILRWQSGGPAGKLAGTFDPALKIDGRSVAFFGFWESPDDPAIDHARFAEFEFWAKQQGATRAYGPIDSTTLAKYRLQTSAFEDPATFPGEPRNPPRYPQRIEELGYRVAQGYVTYWSARIEEIRAWALNAAGGAWGKLAKGFRIVPVDETYWTKRRNDLRLAVNDIFSENFAFKPVDAITFNAAFGSGFIAALCKKSSFVVESDSGEIAGLCACFPGADLTLNVKTVGIVSSFRGRGISLVAMILEILARAGGYERVALCMMREGNFPSLILRPLVESERRYALYYKDL
jgi:hypothetical protein